MSDELRCLSVHPGLSSLPETRLDEISSRFDSNLGRVEHLMAVFDQLTETDAEGVTVHQSDVLRAAVVFLHASLEDLLRSTLAHTLPYADRSVLSDLNLRLHDDVRGTKFLVADLVELRGLAVDEVIENAVERFLETTNFSHIDAVDWALKASGLHANEILGAHRAGLAALISRRHLIAHRADRHPSPQATGAAPISKQQVEAWQRSVQWVAQSLATRKGSSHVHP